MQLHIKFESRDGDYDVTPKVMASLHLNAAYLCKGLFLFLCFSLSGMVSAATVAKQNKRNFPDEIINGADYRPCNSVNIRPGSLVVS